MNFAVRSTDRCNLNCAYCYARVSNSKDMSLKTLELVLTEIAKHSDNGEIVISWTGGEPLLLGMSFLEKIIDVQKNFPEKKFVNILQSNLTLLNEKFTEFLGLNNFEVRTSLDLPACHHDELRVENNFAETLEKIKFLQRSGVTININTVITDRNVGYAKEMYEFIKENKIKSFSVSRFIAQGNGAKNMELAISENEKFAMFLNDMFDMWINDKDSPVKRITPLDKLIRACKGSTAPCFHCQEQLLAFDPSGNIFPSCNKFLGLPDSCLGNIYEKDIKQALSSKEKEIFIRKVKGVTEKICSQCEYVSICEGGCFYVAYATQMNSQNLESITRREFCKGYHYVFAHIIKYLKDSEGGSR